MEEANGFWCQNCNRQYENAVPTFNFSMRVSDMSSTLTVGCLGEMGEDLLGMSAKDFYEIRSNIDEIKEVRTRQVFKNFSLTIRAKKDSMSNSQDESGIRYSVIRVNPHSFQKANASLLQLLDAYQAKETL